MAIRVFIFDDDELIRMTLSSYLHQEGYEVAAFQQPDHCPLYFSDDCVCLKDQGCTDVIITDLNMPGTSGVKFIQRQLSHGCKVKKIAVMSGDWGDPALDIARDLGCKIFKKPFSILEIKKWLDEVRRSIEHTNTGESLVVWNQMKEEKQKNAKIKPALTALTLKKPVK